MPIVFPKAPRWYDQQGNPLYEVPCKGKPGTMRAFSLADARKMDPKPLVSVTSVLQVLAKPELEAWKIEQGITAALTLPRLPDEPTDAFAIRVVKDMNAEVDTAADFGRTIHRAIEAHLTGDMPALQALPESVTPWLDEFIKWQNSVQLTVHSTELVVMNKGKGYAGRMDLYGEIGGIGEAVCDFKSQRVKNGKPAFYDEWALQLAAYAYANHPEMDADVTMMNVVIDSQKPSPPIVKVWEDPQKHYEAFLNALALWKYLKNYP